MISLFFVLKIKNFKTINGLRFKNGLLARYPAINSPYISILKASIMSKTKLEYAKACLRVDFIESDAVLQGYLDAAEQRVIKDTQRSLKELCAMSPDGMSLPADLQTAVIALAGAWYASPEAYTTMSTSAVPEAYELIISPYKRLV